MFVLLYILCLLSIFDTGKICQGNSAELAVDDRRSKSTGDYLSLFEFQSIGLLGLLQFCDAVMNKPVLQRFLQRLQWDLTSPSMFCHWDLVRSFGEETLPWEQGQAECRGRKIMEKQLKLCKLLRLRFVKSWKKHYLHQHELYIIDILPADNRTGLAKFMHPLHGLLNFTGRDFPKLSRRSTRGALLLSDSITCWFHPFRAA